MNIPDWVSALAAIFSAYIAWRMLRVQQSRGADSTSVPTELHGVVSPSSGGSSSADMAPVAGVTLSRGTAAVPQWVTFPARKWMWWLGLVLTIPLFFVTLLVVVTTLTLVVHAEGDSDATWGLAIGMVAFGLMLGVMVRIFRIVAHPFELAIGPVGLRRREAGRTWLVGWDEVRQVAVRRVQGKSAILLWTVADKTYPSLNSILLPVGPVWVARKRAVAFAYTMQHRGGLQAISAALRRYAGSRWSEE